MGLKLFGTLLEKWKSPSLQRKEELTRISPISLEEKKPLEKLERRTPVVDEKEELESLRADLKAFLDYNQSVINKIYQIPDYQFKSDPSHVDSFDEIMRIQNILQKYLNTLDQESSLHRMRKTFQEYAFRATMIQKMILERYRLTVVEEGYHFDGTKEEYTKWRIEATRLFPGEDLSIFTDDQLKQYVVAVKNNPDALELIRQSLDVRRSAEHVRLLWNCMPDESSFQEALAHPEYTYDQMCDLMPDLLTMIGKGKKVR